VDVVRDRGTLGRVVDDGWVENVYRLQIMNATENSQTYIVTAEGLSGLLLDRREPLTLAPAEARWIAVAARVPPEVATNAGSGAHPLRFLVTLQTPEGTAAHRVVEKATFLVPR
jgi:polyferredoxin